MTKSKNQSKPAETGFSLISNQKLLALYSTMIACRRIVGNSNGNSRRSTGKSGSLKGHEAAAVGTAIDLLPSDTVVPALWPEAALKAINPAVPIAARVKLAKKAEPNDNGDRNITLFFSPGARGPQAQWLKALALAAEHSLPFLFVSLDGAEGFDAEPNIGFPTIAVDGNDVVAVYRVASEAITHARKGHGPTLIDCHLSIAGDPIENMHSYLKRKGLNPEKLAV